MVIIEQKIDISIIVPLYNEEANITLLLNKILENIKPICKQYEIIFIDDGST
ncbi:glycosyltransferase, partial [Candidatus Woesearchaeota archaeon]|nr:glycosyltransferase [Candidatus Woesearchaeota archaeon]